MVDPKVYADFQNADASGRLRLNCVRTSEDLAQQRISLREGMVLTLCSDDLDAKGQLDELLVDSFPKSGHRLGPSTSPNRQRTHLHIQGTDVYYIKKARVLEVRTVSSSRFAARRDRRTFVRRWHTLAFATVRRAI